MKDQVVKEDVKVIDDVDTDTIDSSKSVVDNTVGTIVKVNSQRTATNTILLLLQPYNG